MGALDKNSEGPRSKEEMPERDAQAMARPAAVGPWIRCPSLEPLLGQQWERITAVILMMSSLFCRL